MKPVNAKKYFKFLSESKTKIISLRKLSLGTNILEDVILDEIQNLILLLE